MKNGQDDTPFLLALAAAYGELDMAGASDEEVLARSTGTVNARHAARALWARLGYVASGGTREGFDRLAEGALDGDPDAEVQLEAVVALSRHTLGKVSQIAGGRRGGRQSKKERDSLLNVLIDHWTQRAVDDPTRLTAVDACGQVHRDLRGYGCHLPDPETLRTRYSKQRKAPRPDLTYDQAFARLVEALTGTPV